ncbi:MAG: amidohydrolase family protein [Acetobacteraceae bacterium]|nr:amidohydrolase family protein [Acetobacteraceae bacterium]
MRQEWLDRVTEPALEPELPMFDAHHHLWDRPGWRYLFDELLADVNGSGHHIIGTAFMQCQAMYRADGPPSLRPVGETEFVNGVAAMAASGNYGEIRACAAIIGHADLRLGKQVENALHAHLAAAPARFRGIRHVTTWDADSSLMNPLSAGPPGMLLNPQFREGFACLAPLGLLFEAWLFHPQLPELIDLARAFPGTTIVLNHCGGIVGIGTYAGRREEVFRHWSQSVTELAGCPNVHVKLGGLGMRINGFGFELGENPPASDHLATAWRPYIETCIEAFGAERCLFESNFPVDKGSYSYGACWNAFKRLTQDASPSERGALFRNNAISLYRLEDVLGTAWA